MLLLDINNLEDNLLDRDRDFSRAKAKIEDLEKSVMRLTSERNRLETEVNSFSSLSLYSFRITIFPRLKIGIQLKYKSSLRIMNI